MVAMLRVFSEQEQQRLELFLQSPYFSKGVKAQQSLLLVQLICRYLSEGSAAGAWSPEKIYAQIFTDKDTYRAPTLNNLISHTLKLVRKFIEIEMLTQNLGPVRTHTLHTQFFLDKGEFDLCDKYLNRLEEQRTLEETWDDAGYYANWQAEWVKSMCQGMQNRVTDDYNLKVSLSALEKFYLLQRLDILATLFNQNRLTPVIDPTERQILIDGIEGWAYLPFFERPVVQLYRKVLLFLHLEEKAAEPEFDAFLELLYQEEKNLSLSHLKRFESFAYNFCVRRFTQEKFRNILFDLFHRWVQPDRLSQQETVQSNLMLSMVHTGLLTQQFDWVNAFLEAYRHRISGTQPSEDYYQFGRALYFFNMNQFDRAQNLLVQLNFHEILLKYFSKTLTIKVFYEIGKENFDLIQTHLYNLKVALYRENRMPEEKKDRYKLFVRFMNRLVGLQLEPELDRSALRKLATDVNNKQNAAEWKWLTLKIKALLEP